MVRGLKAALAVLSVGWTVNLAAQPDQSAPDLDMLLKQFRASAWETRAGAVEKLAADPRMLEAPAARRALIQLLDQENKYLKGPRQLAQSDAEGEAYAEYYSMLLGRVDSLIDPGDVQSVSILIKSAYNSDSPLALKWASYGQTVVPALLEMNASPDVQRRADSCEVLGNVLRHHRLGTSRYPLAKRSVRTIEDRLRAGLRDPSPSVRMEAIQGVKAAGDLALIPILKQLSMSDPWISPGTDQHFIRQLAAEAIAAIQANPLGK